MPTRAEPSAGGRGRRRGAAGPPCRGYEPTQEENCEVEPVVRFVAVAVSARPDGTAATATEKAPLPAALVVRLREPRNCLPSPPPEASQAGLAKSSIRYCVDAAPPASGYS